MDRRRRLPPGLMALLDRRTVRAAPALRRRGVRCFQLRMKSETDRERIAALRRLVRSVPGCLTLMNDRADLARAGGAGGVHLGQDDLPVAEARRLLGPRAVIGISAGTAAEARRAARSGADYVSVGPAFRTRTKRDAGRPLGPGGVGRLVRSLRRAGWRGPVLAVGGITIDNVGGLMRTGLAGVAVASGLTRHPEAAGRFVAAVGKPAKPNDR